MTGDCSQNLIYALEASLKSITEGTPSLEDRFKIHKEASKKFKAAALALGFKQVRLLRASTATVANSFLLHQVALNPEHGANGMTAVYVPEGTAPAAVIGALGARNIVIAGGLHKDIKTKFVLFALPPAVLAHLTMRRRYIRFGHMGQSVVDPSRDDLPYMISSLESAWAEVSAK